MRPPTIEQPELLDRITAVFQKHGFEGASLTHLTEATGLKRASLYHRFPGGKAEMAQAVLDHVAQRFAHDLLRPIDGHGTPEQRLADVLANLREFYCGGSSSCLLDTLAMGRPEAEVRARLTAALGFWVERFAALAQLTGADEATATARAQRAVILLQGGLVLARVTQDAAHFEHMLAALPRVLLAGVLD